MPRLLPDTLFGRLFLATCVPILIMLALSYALVLRDRQQLASRLGGSSATVNRITDYVQRLALLEDEARAEAVRQANAEVRIAIQQPVVRAPTPSSTAANNRNAQAALDDFYLKPLGDALGDRCVTQISPGGRMVEGFVDLARPPPVSYAGYRALSNEPVGPVPEGPPPVPATTTGAAAAGVSPGGMSPGGMSPAGVSPGGAPPGGASSGGASPGPGRGLYDVAIACAGHTPVHFRVPAPPDLPSIDARLSWQLVLLTGMLGLVLFVMTRRLTAPLRELQRAAEAVGRTVDVPHVQEVGAFEVRQSLRAFNTMQDRLRRYLDSRTRLAAMSHDLRTPLTRLRLRAESIDAPEVRARLISDIEEMDDLVNHSLDLFRGLNEQERTLEVDMNEFIADLAAECHELQLPVTVSGAAARPATVRPLALKRALRNLVDNACKYAGGAELTLADGNDVVIRVRDHGPGIPEDKLRAVMEPFNRLETSRNRDSGGVGLGLTIARDVAEIHGGTLSLANAPDGGLVATMRLPRV